MKKTFATKFKSKSSNLYVFSNNKTYAYILLFLCVIALFAGIISAIRFSTGILPINFSNVTFINFLKSKSSWMWLFFSGIFSTVLFCVVFVLCFSSKYLSIVGIIFFLYYCYARMVTLISMLLIYGFINTLILFLALLIFTLAYCLIYILLMLSCKETRCSSPPYFKNCVNFSKANLVLPFVLILLGVSMLESITLGILKNFVVILIY